MFKYLYVAKFARSDMEDVKKIDVNMMKQELLDDIVTVNLLGQPQSAQ